MNDKETCVHVIVDRSYGDRLLDLPADEPLWVVSSKINEQAVAVLPDPSDKARGINGTTVFDFDPKLSESARFISQVESIDLHHGRYSRNPPYSVMNVIGVKWSEEIAKVLRKFGFVSHESTADGFIARKSRSGGHS